MCVAAPVPTIPHVNFPCSLKIWILSSAATDANLRHFILRALQRNRRSLFLCWARKIKGAYSLSNPSSSRWGRMTLSAPFACRIPRLRKPKLWSFPSAADVILRLFVLEAKHRNRRTVSLQLEEWKGLTHDLLQLADKDDTFSSFRLQMVPFLDPWSFYVRMPVSWCQSLVFQLVGYLEIHGVLSESARILVSLSSFLARWCIILPSKIRGVEDILCSLCHLTIEGSFCAVSKMLLTCM